MGIAPADGVGLAVTPCWLVGAADGAVVLATPDADVAADVPAPGDGTAAGAEAVAGELVRADDGVATDRAGPDGVAVTDAVPGAPGGRPTLD